VRHSRHSELRGLRIASAPDRPEPRAVGSRRREARHSRVEFPARARPSVISLPADSPVVRGCCRWATARTWPRRCA
jgi:hypothetical protein